MEIKGLKLRWITAACYEIKLPNGKTIVTDPYISPNHFKNFKWQEIEGADYIIQTHTHFDHTVDAGNLAKKFNSKIIMEGAACYEFAHCFDINYDQFYPVAPGETFWFEDFKVEVRRSKHNVAGRPEPEKGLNLPKGMLEQDFSEYGIGDHKMLNEYGSIYSLDFYITTKENVRILISSGALFDGTGGMIYNNVFEYAAQFNPNIVIRQATRLGTPAFFASVLNKFGAQIYFPFHHEAMDRRASRDPSQMNTKQYIEATDAELQKISTARLVNPQQFQWYTIGSFVVED